MNLIYHDGIWELWGADEATSITDSIGGMWVKDHQINLLGQEVVVWKCQTHTPPLPHSVVTVTQDNKYYNLQCEII